MLRYLLRLKNNFKLLILLIGVISVILFYRYASRYINENKILKEVVARLEADSRIAEVLVTKIGFDEKTLKTSTTIKFLEYDTKGRPLKPKYFTFPGNIIQFQSLVVRFEDLYIRKKDELKGKSIYLFWKVFMLDGANTKEYELAKLDSIPEGYRLKKETGAYEEKIWKRFWEYALNPERAGKLGIKNAQIEAPGSLFIPGTLYIIRIEHDGGIRIDAKPLPDILRGEYIPA